MTLAAVGFVAATTIVWLVFGTLRADRQADIYLRKVALAMPGTPSPMPPLLREAEVRRFRTEAMVGAPLFFVAFAFCVTAQTHWVPEREQGMFSLLICSLVIPMSSVVALLAGCRQLVRTDASHRVADPRGYDVDHFVSTASLRALHDTAWFGLGLVVLGVATIPADRGFGIVILGVGAVLALSWWGAWRILPSMLRMAPPAQTREDLAWRNVALATTIGTLASGTTLRLRWIAFWSVGWTFIDLGADGTLRLPVVVLAVLLLAAGSVIVLRDARVPRSEIVAPVLRDDEAAA